MGNDKTCLTLVIVKTSDPVESMPSKAMIVLRIETHPFSRGFFKINLGDFMHWNHPLYAVKQMDNYIVRSYRDVIVVTKIATKRTSKAQSIVMY